MTKYLTETKEEGPDDCKRGPPMATSILVLGQNIMAEDGGGGGVCSPHRHMANLKEKRNGGGRLAVHFNLLISLSP